MSDNQMVPHNETGIERIKHYIYSVEVKERFEEMMGKGASYYLNQVMAVVAGSNKLQACSPKSIYISAIRAASLRLSLDPSLGQAYIVPYNGVANYQTGYKGIYALAMRTGKYRYAPHAFEIYEGQTFLQDWFTGLHKLEGERISSTVIGYGMAFTLFSGTSATHYMSVEEIDAHAEHYSPSYHHKDSPWNDPFERPKMRKKTLFSAGMRMYGVFDEGDKKILNEIESEAEWHDVTDLPDEDAVHDPEPLKLPEGVSRMEALGYATDPEPAAPESAKINGYSVNTIAKIVEDHKKAADDVLKILKDAKAVGPDSDVMKICAWFDKYAELRGENHKHADSAGGADKFIRDLETHEAEQAEQASFIDPQVGQP